MPNDNGIYVWRDLKRGGTPIGSLADINTLIDFCKNQGIRRILYDNWGNGLPDNKSIAVGTGRQEDTFLRMLISMARKAGINIEALYTDKVNIGDVIAYNNGLPWFDITLCGRFIRYYFTYRGELRYLSWKICFPRRIYGPRFAGIRMDFEGPDGHLPGWEPTTPGDIDYYAKAKADADAGNVPLYVSIGWHWGTENTDTEIQYTYKGNTKTQRAYKHILDIVDGVDIQPGSDKANDIFNRVKPILIYAKSKGKPAWITIETMGPPSGETFAEEGEVVMKAETAAVSASLAAVPPPDGPLFPTEFIYHFYRSSYGGGQLQTKWPPHP